MVYSYLVSPSAHALSSQLIKAAGTDVDDDIELDEKRERAVRAMAAQIRAQRAADTDEQLVRTELKRQRDVRLAHG